MGLVARLVQVVAAYALLGAVPAFAERVAPASSEQRYEDRLASRALTKLGRALDPAPEGKRLRTIHVVSEGIIGPDDPYPSVLNALHVTTRESVIRRELLFAEGDAWSELTVAETERNLRGLHIIAVARIVPLANPEAPDSVDALVVTRDLWSIRFNSSFNLVGSLLQYLRIRPTEQNLFGLDKQLAADFELRLDTLAFGQEFADRRLFGTRLQLKERAALVFNRATGRLEGTEGHVSLGRPLFSLTTEWGFALDLDWNVRRERLFRGAELVELELRDGGRVPWVYDRRTLHATGFYTRSFGRTTKTNLSFGGGAYSQRAAAPEGVSPAEAALLRERVLPRTEDALYAATKLHLFAADYRVLRDLQTFALSEDYQVGPAVLAEGRVGVLDGGAPFLEGAYSARYRVAFANSLVSAALAGGARVCLSRCDERTVVNQRLAAELSYVSPFAGPGRFAARGTYEARRNDLDRTVLQLGGGNGLRGLAPEALSGTRRLLFNLEYRTRPVEVRTLHLGGVVFFDSGAAWAEGAPQLVHTVGVGLRALFPQFDVEPLRIDFGYVLNAANPPPLERASSAFGQVSRYRPKMLDQPFE